jgi:hypothetical protein
MAFPEVKETAVRGSDRLGKRGTALWEALISIMYINPKTEQDMNTRSVRPEKNTINTLIDILTGPKAALLIERAVIPITEPAATQITGPAATQITGPAATQITGPAATQITGPAADPGIQTGTGSGSLRKRICFSPA